MPLPRPDETSLGPPPPPPVSSYAPVVMRFAAVRRLSCAEVEECYELGEILDELDARAWLRDCDSPPTKPTPPRGPRPRTRPR